MMRRTKMAPPKVEAPKEPPAEKPMKAAGLPDFMQRAKRPGGMAKGGKVHADAAMDRKLIREEINKTHKKMGMAKGGAVKGYAKGGMMKGKK